MPRQKHIQSEIGYGHGRGNWKTSLYYRPSLRGTCKARHLNLSGLKIP